MDELKELLKAHYRILPDNLRVYVSGMEWVKTVELIGQKHNVFPEKLEGVKNETLFVLLGFAAPATFADAVEKEVRLPHDLAVKVASDIALTIFAPRLKEIAELEKIQAELDRNAGPIGGSPSSALPSQQKEAPIKILPAHTETSPVRKTAPPPPNLPELRTMASDIKNQSIKDKNAENYLKDKLSKMVKSGEEQEVVTEKPKFTDRGYVGKDPYREAAR